MPPPSIPCLRHHATPIHPMPPPSIPSLRPHQDEPAARINTPSSGAAALCTHHPTRPSPLPGCRQSAAGATPRCRLGRMLPRGHRRAGHRRGRRGAHALSSRCVPCAVTLLTRGCRRTNPRLQPSAAPGCSPLLPHQARASAEAALQQLSHALRALRATWAGALPAALSRRLLGALVDAPVRQVVDACLALRHISEVRGSPWYSSP